MASYVSQLRKAVTGPFGSGDDRYIRTIQEVTYRQISRWPRHRALSDSVDPHLAALLIGEIRRMPDSAERAAGQAIIDPITYGVALETDALMKALRPLPWDNVRESMAIMISGVRGLESQTTTRYMQAVADVGFAVSDCSLLLDGGYFDSKIAMAIYDAVELHKRHGVYDSEDFNRTVIPVIEPLQVVSSVVELCDDLMLQQSAKLYIEFVKQSGTEYKDPDSLTRLAAAVGWAFGADRGSMMPVTFNAAQEALGELALRSRTANRIWTRTVAEMANQSVEFKNLVIENPYEASYRAFHMAATEAPLSVQNGTYPSMRFDDELMPSADAILRRVWSGKPTRALTIEEAIQLIAIDEQSSVDMPDAFGFDRIESRVDEVLALPKRASFDEALFRSVHEICKAIPEVTQDAASGDVGPMLWTATCLLQMQKTRSKTIPRRATDWARLGAFINERWPSLAELPEITWQVELAVEKAVDLNIKVPELGRLRDGL